MKLINNVFSKETLKQWEGACTIGNGYINIRGSLDFELPFATQNDTYWRMPANVTVEEAKHPFSKWGVYIPGIVGQHPLLNEEMVNLPYFLGCNLIVENERVQLEEARIEEYHCELDMETAIFSYGFAVQHHGKKIQIEAKRYCDLLHPHLVVQSLQVQSDQPLSFAVECFIDMDITTNGYHHFVTKKGIASAKQLSVEVTTDLGNHIAMAQQIETSGEVKHEMANDERVSLCVYGETTIEIKRTTAIVSNIEESDPAWCASEELQRFCLDAHNFETHQQRWLEEWKLHRVIIEGDEKAQQALDFSIFHLMRSKSNFDTVAIDAKGAAGEAYFGHYFWDTEIYLLPFYLYSDPQKAKDLLMFRVHTLDAAIENAKQYGYEGAKFPWESSISGKEQCPNWQYKDHEIHISFDIVYAMQSYFSLTKDEKTCKEAFFPVVENVAKFALSRAYLDQDGVYHLNGVMGPDEYIMFCDDNAYTNVMAIYSVRVYLAWCEQFKQPLSNEKKQQYLAFCEHLHIPMKNELILQCKDFEAFEDLDFSTVWKEPNKPFGAQISQEHNYRCKALKQADTLSLFYLFDQCYPERLQQHMSYYLPITTHDSSLSYVIHSILFQRLGNSSDAYAYFEKACSIDLDGQGAAEGIHIANAGGLWQAIVFGFAGVGNGMWQDNLTLQPALPSHWKKLAFSLLFHGQRYHIEIDQTGAKVSLEEAYAK